MRSEYLYFRTVKSYSLSRLLLNTSRLLSFFIFHYSVVFCQHEMLTMHAYNGVMMGKSLALCLVTQHESNKCFRGAPEKAL